jgi:NAD(P) transhydrogenase
MERFDLVVIGCGPAGERAAIHAARAGRRVAVVECEHVVGGNRVNWGTIPSKTLRESALFFLSVTRNKLHGIRVEIDQELTVADFMHRERQVVQRELEIAGRSLARYEIEVIHGHGRLHGPKTVTVHLSGARGERVLSADTIIIATGSSPNRPADVPFDGRLVFDSETILTLPRLPRSLTVLGAGVIGVEYASIFAALGIRVTLVDTRDRLLPYLDREIVAVFQGELSRLGVTIIHSDRYEKIETVPGNPPTVRCRTMAARTLESEGLLYCVGRDGNSQNLGLETVGLASNAYGLIEVDANYRTGVPGLYAVGDVIGYPALASTAMEQGRRAARNAFGIAGAAGPTTDMPFAIYAIPEISYVGLTEEQLREQALPYVVGLGQYGMNPRGQIIGDHGGLLKLLFAAPGGRLLGAHIVGTSASELIHVGQAFLRGGTTAEQIAETLYNYPTLADLYRHAALVALAELRRTR